MRPSASFKKLGNPSIHPLREASREFAALREYLAEGIGR